MKKSRPQLGFEPRTSSTQMRNANHYTTEADQDVISFDCSFVSVVFFLFLSVVLLFVCIFCVCVCLFVVRLFVRVCLLPSFFLSF